MRGIVIGAAALAALAAGPCAAADEPAGTAGVKAEFADRVVHQMGFVIGNLPNPAGGQIVLVPESAIYTKNLDFPRAVRGWSGSEGQVLDIPAVDLSKAVPFGPSLRAVWLSWGRGAASAACLGSVRLGQSVQIASIAQDGAGGPRVMPGRVERREGGNFIVAGHFAHAGGVRQGDPVLVGSLDGLGKLDWQILGVVGALRTPDRVEVVSVRRIFEALPAEATWALQPPGLCDPAERTSPERGYSRALQRLFEPAAKDIFVRDTMPAPLELLAAMRKHWKPMAAYLSRPSIEHYFFHPHLTPDVQMDLFWQSIISATGSGEVLIHTPAAALGPIARVRAEGGAALGRGWGVALARVDDGDYASILVVTAAHLVEPVSGKERDIKVYFPFLQGFGVSARRMPIADRTLDLGLVAVDQFPARLLPRIFDVFWTACPDVQSGPVDVPLDVMGWRRERLRGTLSPGDSRGAIRVLGVESRPGFSGGAVVRNGVEIAGMLTRHTGGPDGAVGASIEAMLRLIPLGQRFRASPDCSADSLERRAAFAVTKAFLKKERPALPDSRLLTALFGGEQAARIRVGELPRFDRYELGRGETPVDLAGRCGVVNGQGRTPESDRFLEATAPRDAQGRPVIKPEDTVGCSLPLDGRGPTLIFLRDNIEIPACIVGSARRGSHGVPLVYWSGRFWDGTFLGRCHQLHVKRHEPAGWVRATARRMPWNHSVRDIPAGPFTMGPCEGIRFEVGKAPVPGFCDGKVPGPVDQSFVRHTAAYRISRFPVTVEEYAWCVADGRCTYKRPETELGQVRSNRDCNWGHAGRERHPMNCIDWQEAAQFCTVLGGQLPTETQWEKSARGTDGRSTPWKDPRFGSRALALDDTMEVGLMSELASPYGIEDIVTQLGEWTRSPMFDDADAYAKAFSNERVTRGRLDALSRDSSEKGYARLGFRCVFTAR